MVSLIGCFRLLYFWRESNSHSELHKSPSNYVIKAEFQVQNSVEYKKPRERRSFLRLNTLKVTHRAEIPNDIWMRV